MMLPGSSYGDSTRANDAERADVCAILDNAYADGELDGDEHRQRCSSAMSAKTRGQLLGLISDLQARPPVFAQQPTIAVKANPNRKWIVGATVGGVLAVIVIVGFIATRHSSSRPSPTAVGPVPTAAIPAPTAPPAPTATHGSEATGTYLPVVDVVGTVSGDFQDDIGHAPEHVDCPGDLAGRVGAFERCSIVDNGKRYSADVTVTAVNGIRISTHESID